jgi:aspartate aminotransferase-like enzyme
MNIHYNLAPGPVDFGMFLSASKDGTVVPHRSDYFSRVHREVKESLKSLVNADNRSEVVFMASSGTGAIEALLKNVLSPGEKLCVLANGFFGERIIRIAAKIGLQTCSLIQPWDKPLDSQKIKDLFVSQAFEKTKAVFAVHLETSTGIGNDIGQIGAMVQKEGLLFLVDAVASVGVERIEMDEWGIDGLITVSYKGLLSPPGLSVLLLSPKCAQTIENADGLNSYYFDLKKMVNLSRQNTTFTTVPINSFYVLKSVLDYILLSGKYDYIEQKKKFAQYFRGQLRANGIQIYGESGFSNALTSLVVSQTTGSDGASVKKVLEKDYSIYVGGGLGILAKSVIRVAHYGTWGEKDVSYIVLTLSELLKPSLSGCASVNCEC